MHIRNSAQNAPGPPHDNPTVRSNPGCSDLGQPGTSFWVDTTFGEEGARGLHERQFGFEILNASPGICQGINVTALDPRLATGVNASLAAPLVERVDADGELIGEQRYTLTIEHSLTNSESKLRRVLKRHDYLLVVHDHFATKNWTP